MERVPIESGAVERAQWLAELSEALEEAQRLAWHMSMVCERPAAAMELYVQLETVRGEVQSLQLRRASYLRTHSDPNWTKASWNAELDPFG